MINKIFILILFLTSISCRKKDSFEEAKEIYNANKQSFSEIISLLNSNKKVYFLNRYESTFSDKVFSDKSYWVNYTLGVSTIRRGFIIFIDSSYQNNESLFWEKDLAKIKTNQSLSLQEILDSNDISNETFMQLKDFLSKNNFNTITRIIDSDYIIILIDQTTGLIYTPQNTVPKYVEAQDIKKIDDHMYYFKLRP